MGDRNFKIGPWTVQPDLDRIYQGSLVVNLRPQVMEILVYLAGQNGRVVSQNELHDNIWAGRIVTSGSLYNGVAELRQALASGHDDQVYIETIAKKGYRLTATVTPDPDPASQSVTKETDNPRLFAKRLRGVIAFGILLVLSVILFLWQKPVPDAEYASSASEFDHDLPRLLVLPFQNLSNDPDQNYFSDGVTGEILNTLSRSPGLRVIARSTAFALSDRQLSISEITEELDVDYIVEGTVARDQDRLRISWQLVRTNDGVNIQGQALDHTLGDVFLVQQDIASRIAGVLGRSLADDATPQLTQLTSAYDLYLRALDLQRQADQHGLEQAEELFTGAIELDPGFIKARNGLARNHLARMVHRPDEGDDLLDMASDQIRESLTRQPGNANAHGLRLQVQFYRAIREGKVQEARKIAELLAAHVLREGSDPYVHSVVSYWLVEYLGEPEQALRLLGHGLEIDPLNSDLLWTLASYHDHFGNRETSRGILEGIISRSPDYWWAYESLSNLAFDEGDLAGSLAWIRRALEADPHHALMEALMAVRLYRFGFVEEADTWLTHLDNNPNSGALLDVVRFFRLVTLDNCAEIATESRRLLAETQESERNSDYLGRITPYYAHCMAVLGRTDSALAWFRAEYPNAQNYQRADFSGNEAIDAQDYSLHLASLTEDRAAVAVDLQNWHAAVEDSGWRRDNVFEHTIDIRKALLDNKLEDAERIVLERFSQLSPTHDFWTALSNEIWYARLREREAVSVRLEAIHTQREVLRAQVAELLQSAEWNQLPYSGQ